MRKTGKLVIILFIWLASGCGDKNPIQITQTEDHLTLMDGQQPLVRYVHSETPPPDTADPLFRRSAYIHPLWSPGGEVLTRIQPADHLHHYGIWNPWTRVEIDSAVYDLWNLGAGQGRVRFAEYLQVDGESPEPGFLTRHEHVYFTEDGTENRAMDETWEVRIRESGKDRYLLDLEVTLSTPVEEGIVLQQYRYGGGLGFRATERWGTENSTVTTSEGKTREDADATRARWVIIEGESSVSEGRSGILFLSHPGNFSHPEPMRMWPPDQYEGKGNVFFEFTPIRHESWPLEPGREYSLRYRMVVFDGEIGKDEADVYWNTFAGK